MATIIARKNARKTERYFAQCNIQIPLALKNDVELLKINLTQAAIAGIEEAVRKAKENKT